MADSSGATTVIMWAAAVAVVIVIANGAVNRLNGKTFFAGLLETSSVSSSSPAATKGRWKPTVDCAAMGGTRTVNPVTKKPSCFVPD